MSVVVIGADAEFEGRCELLLGDDLVVLPPAGADTIVSRIVHLDRRPEVLVLGSHMPTDKALELGLIINAPNDESIRIAPPLTIGDAEIAEFISLFATALEASA